MQVFIVRGSEIAIRDGGLEERPVFVPVPIEEKGVDVAGRGGRDFLFEDFGV